MTPRDIDDTYFLKMNRVKSRLNQFNWLFQPVAFTAAYGFWVLSFRLITLTFITYYTISPTSQFQDISDAFSSNEVTLISLSAVLFVGLLASLGPLTSVSLSDVINRQKIERSFLPGFIQGAFFAGSIVLIFVLSGFYRYLGYFIQLNEAPLELVNVLLRMAALGSLAYCEEFIFRNKILQYLQGHLPEIAKANLAALLYCGIKILQFDIGIMHLITLYLISISLFYRTSPESPFSKGAGFWAAILIIFHPLLSLPIFGNDFSGVLLIKYQSLAKVGASSESFPSWIRFLTGGAGGPISSFAFQTLLILDIGRSILRRKKTT